MSCEFNCGPKLHILRDYCHVIKNFDENSVQQYCNCTHMRSRDYLLQMLCSSKNHIPVYHHIVSIGCSKNDFLVGILESSNENPPKISRIDLIVVQNESSSSKSSQCNPDLLTQEFIRVILFQIFFCNFVSWIQIN